MHRNYANADLDWFICIAMEMSPLWLNSAEFSSGFLLFIYKRSKNYFPHLVLMNFLHVCDGLQARSGCTSQLRHATSSIHLLLRPWSFSLFYIFWARLHLECSCLINFNDTELSQWISLAVLRVVDHGVKSDTSFILRRICAIIHTAFLQWNHDFLLRCKVG